MSKKAFHPGSHANQKRIQEAEARAAAKRKHDEETLEQYRKEQELFQQRSLVSRESKDKLSLNFMYEAPPGTAKDEIIQKIPKKEKAESSSDDDEEPKIILKWQRDEPKKRVKKEK